jgi:hypothetical protein
MTLYQYLLGYKQRKGYLLIQPGLFNGQIYMLPNSVYVLVMN